MTNVLFIDVDGTLITTKDGKQYLPPSAVDAMRQVRARGGRIYLCTGRSLAEMLRHCDEAIVMGDARHDVRGYATFVTKGVAEDGLAHAMRHFALID